MVISRFAALAAALLLLAAPTYGGIPARSAGTADTVVTVSPNTGSTIVTQMSTNDVWSGMVDETRGARARLQALHAPLVRLHVGDDGDPVALPEVQKGQWSFAALNALVNDVRRTGRQPLMNIKFAPDWMWTCYPNSVGVSPNGAQGVGTVADLTFRTFAAYMANLVRYYNKGSMTTETGTVITNPARTANRVTFWELWNEPDLNNETPCAPPSGIALSPAQYVTMWNTVTAAMLAVDPTLAFVGPATSGGQFGAGNGNAYVSELMSRGRPRPVAISFHGYGYWDNSVTDRTIFDGDSTGAGGIPDIVRWVKIFHTQYPREPIWLTEVNVNADWDNDPYERPWTALGAAWWGTLFTRVAPLGVGIIHQYDLIDDSQFGLLPDETGTPTLPYWVIMVLNQAFPKGSTLLQSHSSRPGILSLAARHPDGTISVLLVNRQVNDPGARGGTGLPARVTLDMHDFKVGAIQLVLLDGAITIGTGLLPVTLPASTIPGVAFTGYGMAILTFRTAVR